MLTIFTIPKAFEGATAVRQRNAVQSWMRGCPGCEVILCGDDAGVAGAAAALRVRHLADIRCNEYGTPLLSDAFERVMRIAAGDRLGYVNADIVLLSDLNAAIRNIPFRRFLMSGRRHTLDAPARAIDFSDSAWRCDLDAIVRARGRMDRADALDYFVFPRIAAWALPEFAVGRPGWDNWMIHHARVRGVPVIDATDAVRIMHPAHGYAHVADVYGDRWQGPEGDRNIALAGGKQSLYTLDDATHRLRGTRIVRLGKRKRLHRELEIRAVRYPWLKPLWRGLDAVVYAGERFFSTPANQGGSHAG